jgi:hypothetical protein
MARCSVRTDVLFRTNRTCSAATRACAYISLWADAARGSRAPCCGGGRSFRPPTSKLRPPSFRAAARARRVGDRAVGSARDQSRGRPPSVLVGRTGCANGSNGPLPIAAALARITERLGWPRLWNWGGCGGENVRGCGRRSAAREGADEGGAIWACRRAARDHPAGRRRTSRHTAARPRRGGPRIGSQSPGFAPASTFDPQYERRRR